nr:MAG TPA: hypothetical protein [Caudoviricetes sp.]
MFSIKWVAASAFILFTTAMEQLHYRNENR